MDQEHRVQELCRVKVVMYYKRIRKHRQEFIMEFSKQQQEEIKISLNITICLKKSEIPLRVILVKAGQVQALLDKRSVMQNGLRNLMLKLLQVQEATFNQLQHLQKQKRNYEIA